MLGQKVNNRYRIVAQIGRGAMGSVYHAIDDQTGQDVALKVIVRDLALDSEMLERFRREGDTLRQLRHRNIIAFVDMFPYDNGQAIVMEYVPAGNLHDLIRRGPLPLVRAKEIALELCDALIIAHRLNIVHRDIKPENVLLEPDGTPKLGDFGVAKLLSATERLTGTGALVGTPYYMSPEAWQGHPLTAQSDIWSLGVMLFEMVTGRVPFSGDTLPSVMNKILTEPAPDLRTLRPDAPGELAQIVQRALARDKNLRYSTVRMMSADLEQCSLDGTSIPLAQIRPDRPALADVDSWGPQLRPPPDQSSEAIADTRVARPPASDVPSMRKTLPASIAGGRWPGSLVKAARKLWAELAQPRALPGPKAAQVIEYQSFYEIRLDQPLQNIKERLFAESRGQLLDAIEREILASSSESRIIALSGFRGAGATEISGHICDRIKIHLRQKSLIIQVKETDDQEVTEVLRAILLELKRDGRYTPWHVRQAIERAYRKVYKPKGKTRKLAFKFQSPIQFTVGSPVPGLGGNFGGQPLEVAYEKETESSSPDHPTALTSTDGSGLQLLLETLRELVEALVCAGFKIVLFVDHVKSISSVTPLKAFMHLPNITTVLITEQDTIKEKPVDWFKRSFYVPCLWDLSQDLMQGIGLGGATGPTWTHSIQWHLDFMGQGLPKRLFAALDEFYQDGTPPVLRIPKQRIREIETNARLSQTARNQILFCSEQTGFNYLQLADTVTTDKARIAVYRTLHSLLDISRTANRNIPTSEIINLLTTHGIPFQESQTKKVIAQNIKKALSQGQDTLAGRLHTTHLASTFEQAEVGSMVSGGDSATSKPRAASQPDDRTMLP